MSRTTRHDNGLNKGRDDKPFGAKHLATSSHPSGFDTHEDDHGHYGAGGSRACKRDASRARRIHSDRVVRSELRELDMADETDLAQAADTAERDTLKELLKAHLSLSIGVDYARAYSSNKVMTVKILFDGEVIASDEVYPIEFQG